ncbi:MAG: single-stranded DNA-binding protein [Caldilinea sp.]|nr:single-stranded DNA-binding protein [Caldilinea sp.]
MYQQITIIGHAGADAEMRYTPDGTPVTSFSVATSRKVKDQDRTTWHRVTCWRRLAEITGEHVKRGDRVLVTGTVEARAFADGRSGEPRASLEITADTVRFLGGNSDERSRPTGATPHADRQPAGLDQVDELAF